MRIPAPDLQTPRLANHFTAQISLDILATANRLRGGLNLRPLDNLVLKRLRLSDALKAEKESSQNLMPPTPGWAALASNQDAFMKWLQAQLRAGFSPSHEVIVNARKVGRGVRPVAVWSLADRVVYRALVDFILRNEQELDRSPDAYGKFVGEPIKHARHIDLAKQREDISGPPVSKRVVFSVKSSTFTHVVKSDITAFYQYIDHQILFDELLAKTGDYDAISALIQLLDETQGRRFGLPQLLTPSDRLSEVYIDIVHRSVRRQGFPIWRFSDDFRILCASYEEARGRSSYKRTQDYSFDIRDVRIRSVRT